MNIKQFKLSLAMRLLPFILIPLSLALAVFFTGCSKDPGESLGRKPGGGRLAITFPVETIDVKNQSVTYSIYAVGSVEAFEMVMVTARVNGAVDKVLFSEGTYVQAGQELVEIDPERYRLAVESAKAAWEKAKAAKADAEAGLQRRQQVVAKNPGLIPGEELETWNTRVRTAMAEVALTLAQLNQAELNLHDALVRAPVAGIMQTRTVQTGQYVQPGSVLASMIRRDPLLLRFKVPEQDANRLKTGLKALFNIKDDKNEYTSTINYVAASAEENTRMASVTAIIDDENRERLRPGAFAEIHIPVGSVQNVPVIPQLAIRTSERGFISYIVENGIAKERILTLGMRTADGQVEIRDGLKTGESLVIRGAEALRDGVPVRINNGKNNMINTVPPAAESRGK